MSFLVPGESVLLKSLHWMLPCCFHLQDLGSLRRRKVVFDLSLFRCRDVAFAVAVAVPLGLGLLIEALALAADSGGEKVSGRPGAKSSRNGGGSSDARITSPDREPEEEGPRKSRRDYSNGCGCCDCTHVDVYWC